MEVKSYVVCFSDITGYYDVKEPEVISNFMSLTFVSDAVPMSGRFFNDMYDVIYEYDFFDVKILSIEEGF